MEKVNLNPPISEELLIAIMEAATKLTELDKDKDNLVVTWKKHFKEIWPFVVNVRDGKEAIPYSFPSTKPVAK
jgi:hypothetical protein